MSRVSLSAVVAAALIAAMTPAPVRADTYDKLAYLTFNRPVQIPGTILNAGTYRFRLANPDTSRNVLQVLSYDGSSVYAMFHTTPDSRMAVTDDPTVTFKEMPAGVPPAVQSLFYGGERRGYEFVYPKGGPSLIRNVVVQPEITYTPLPVAAIPEPIAEPEPAAPLIEPVEPAVEPIAAPEELPKTATPVPMVAAGGLASVIAGLGLALLRRRFN